MADLHLSSAVVLYAETVRRLAMPPEQVTVIKLVLTSLIVSRVFCSPYTSLQVTPPPPKYTLFYQILNLPGA